MPRKKADWEEIVTVAICVGICLAFMMLVLAIGKGQAG